MHRLAFFAFSAAAPLLVVASIPACGPSSPPGNGEGSTTSRDAGGSDAGGSDAGGSDAGGSDAGGSDAGGSDAGDASMPDGGGAGAIQAPDDTWTWVDIPGSKCGYGSETGFAVNPHAGATELLIYLEGGGECHDAASCWGPGTSAKNLTGYNQTNFMKETMKPALIRSTAGSPFATTNMAFFPYCTGDLHAGTKEVDFTVNGVIKPTYFVGGNNLDLFLARLLPTFPGVTRVVLLGTSAGGFGTYLNFDKVVRAFGVRVDIIDDSGPPLVAKGATDNAAVMSTWGYVSPAGCSPCTSLLDVMKSARAEQPKSRLGFLSFSVDTTIGPDFGYTAAEYPTLIESLFPTSFGSDPNVQTYIVKSQPGHVVEGVPILEPHYFPWMTAMLNDSPSWTSATYP